MKERQDADERVVGGDRLLRRGLQDVRHQVAVGEHHALGQARGPARVGQRDEVVGAGGRVARAVARVAVEQLVDDADLIDAGAARRLAPAVERVRAGEQRPRPGVLQLEGQLVDRVDRVDRRAHRAEDGDGVEGDHVLGRVGRVEGDDVALADAAAREDAGRRRDGVGGLRVGVGPARRRVDQRGLVAVLGGVLEDELGERDRGYVDVGVRAREDHVGGSLPAMATDFYLLDERLTDEERAIRDRLRAFCEREVTPDHQRLLGAGGVPVRAGARRSPSCGLAGGDDRGLRLPGHERDRRRPGEHGVGARGRQHRHLLRRALEPRDAVDRTCSAPRSSSERWLPAMADAGGDRRVRA